MKRHSALISLFKLATVNNNFTAALKYYPVFRFLRTPSPNSSFVRKSTLIVIKFHTNNWTCKLF